jgi:hypothetical protein
VEIASFTWAMSEKLLLRCSDFIDLDTYYQQVFLPLQQGDPEGQTDMEPGDQDVENTININK